MFVQLNLGGGGRGIPRLLGIERWMDGESLL